MRGSRLNREELARIERWAAREEVECLYLLADAGDPATAPLAEEAGFRLVDVRVTLDRPLPAGGGAGDAVDGMGGVSPARASAAPVAVAVRQAPSAAAPTVAMAVRQAAPADVPELRHIASASHHDSRFYHDPRFDRARCDALYAAWIENSCGDPHGLVLVAAPRPGTGALLGYITAHQPGAPGGEGSIGLFAVAGAAQGQGIGGRLVAGALSWLEGRGAATVSVVTQGRNVRAQRLYQRFGLRTRSLELWFHRWR